MKEARHLHAVRFGGPKRLPQVAQPELVMPHRVVVFSIALDGFERLLRGGLLALPNES